MAQRAGTMTNQLADPEGCERVVRSLKTCALVTVDREQRITGWSEGAAGLLGHEPEAVLGQPLSRVREAPDRWVHRSGRRVAVDAGTSPLPDGGTTLLLCERRQSALADLEAMFSALPDPHCVFDRDGTLVYVSPSAERTLAPQPDFLQQDRARVQETGSPEWGSLRLPHEDGDRDYDYVITPLFEAGCVVATVATLRDVTNRHRAEESLRAAIVHAPVPAMIFAEDGEVLLLSEAWERLSGYSPEELPTLAAWAERAYGESAAEVEQNVLSLFDVEGPTEEGEFTIRTRDGGLRTWQFRSTPLGRTPDGRRVLLSMASDQTELRESERRFRAIFETSALGISLADLQGHPVTTNPALQAMLGYSGDELARLTFRDFTHPDDLEVGIALFGELTSGGRDCYEIDKRYVRKDGSVFWGRLTASLVRDARGTSRFVLAMVEDITERREREALFRATFEGAGAGMVLADDQGCFLSTNRRLQQFLGYEAAELQGRCFVDFTYPDDVELDWGLFEELREGKRDRYEIEKRYVRKDGRVVWGRLIGTALRDDRGWYKFGLGIIEDVTERKEAQETQRRLIAILEATPDAVGIADADGHVVYMNQATREMLGLGDDEPIERSIASCHPDWAASIVLREGLPTAAREGIWRGETALRARDGSEIPVSQVIIAHRGSDGAIYFFSSILRDISDRIRAEAAQRFLLDASRSLSGSLELAATLAGIARLVVPERADYCFVDLVEGGEVSRVEALHRDPACTPLMAELSGYAGAPGGKLGVAEVLRTGEPLLVDEVTEPWLRAISRDDEHLALLRRLRTCSEMIVPLRARGRVIGAITFGSLERRFTADDLALAANLCSRAGLAIDNARLYRDAQRATGIRDEVLRVVAHDLRNPLVSIDLAAQLLRRSLPEREPVVEAQIDSIRRAVDQSNRLIQDLLDVAKVEAGSLTLDTGVRAPADLVGEAFQQHAALVAHRRLELVTEIGEDLPEVRVDERRVLQVFSNLIGNALKFTPQGGRITLRARAVDEAVLFEVSDTGHGVPEDQLPHLFENFWQADHARGSGAGLGLAIVRGIIDAHGGEVSADSEVGVGTTVRFALPTARPRPPRDPLP